MYHFLCFLYRKSHTFHKLTLNTKIVSTAGNCERFVISQEGEIFAKKYFVKVYSPLKIEFLYGL